MADLSSDQSSHIFEKRQSVNWQRIWLAGGLVWGLVLVLLLAIPTDPKNRQFLGYSLNRFALIGVVFLLVFLHLLLAWISKKQSNWRRRFLDPLTSNRQLFIGANVFLTLIAASVWLSALITNGYTRPGRVFRPYTAYYERLAPFLVGIFLECIILIIGLVIQRRGFHPQALRSGKQLWLLTAGILGAFLLVWVFMSLTKIGVTPDTAGWGSPGIPILFYQVLFTWLAGLLFFFLFTLPKSRPTLWQSRAIDGLICLVIWVGAVWAWSNQDVQRSYFLPSPKPPNYEYYPYSDAGFYDYNAQSLLLGYGFMNGQVVPRPLYILLLAGFHAIAGQDYERTIYIQSLILATLPVFLYLLGKTLHSRSLGITVAIVSIIREVNSILATPWVEVSQSKLFMADLMTTTAVIALAWLTARWFTNPRRNWTDALLVGGALGITTLLRTQALLFLPAIFLLAFFYYWKNWKSLAKTTLLVGAGLALVISPWLLRNYTKTGGLVFDDPTTQNALVAQRYSTEIGIMPEQQPGETQSQYAERLSKSIRQFLISNPGFVAKFVTSHELNNMVSTILVIPMKFQIDQRCDTLDLCTPFWISIVEQFSPSDRVMLFLNLLVVSFGIASTWRRWRWAGMVPLVFFLVYSLSNAIARNSARRYILPVDWVGYFYLLIGLFEIAFWTAILFGSQWKNIQKGLTSQTDRAEFGQQKTVVKLVSAIIIFLVIGLSLPAAEWFGKPYYPLESNANLLTELWQETAIQTLPLSRPDLETFSKQGKAAIVKGRIFYPRYYEPEDGEPGSGWPAYKPYEYRSTGKVGFIVVGPSGETQVNLSIDSTPEYFPNAADALVLGCQENRYVDALLVVFLDGSNEAVMRSKTGNLSCPLK